MKLSVKKICIYTYYNKIVSNLNWKLHETIPAVSSVDFVIKYAMNKIENFLEYQLFYNSMSKNAFANIFCN